MTNLLVVILFTVVILFLLWKRKRHNEFWKHISAIPGPKTYPIVGTTQMFLRDPDSMFRVAVERNTTFFPIYKIWSFNIAVVFILSPEDAESVLTNMKHISKSFVYDLLHIWLGTGLLTSTGSKWQSRRKILTPAFHFSILQNFISIFNKETKHLVDDLRGTCGEPYVNVLKPITEYTLNSIGETSLGVEIAKEPNIDAYKSAIHEFGYLFTYRLVRPWLRLKPVYYFSSVARKFQGCVDVLHNFSTNVIQKRKEQYEKTRNDSYSQRKRMAMLDLLLKVRDEEGVDIDDEGIREEVDTFMFEGHDTTSLALCYILLVLANQPVHQEDILQEIRDVLGDSKEFPDFQDLAEMKFMERCIKECLRLFPSVPGIGRILGEDMKTASGHTIPKGANINIMIYGMHRSPEIWEDPEKFDPDRFLPENIATRHPFAYIPFSAGPRNCIGQRFAYLEIKTALCGILRNFELQSVQKPEEVIIRADLVLRPSNEIKVKFVPRKR